MQQDTKSLIHVVLLITDRDNRSTAVTRSVWSRSSIEDSFSSWQLVWTCGPQTVGNSGWCCDNFSTDHSPRTR